MDRHNRTHVRHLQRAPNSQAARMTQLTKFPMDRPFSRRAGGVTPLTPASRAGHHTHPTRPNSATCHPATRQFLAITTQPTMERNPPSHPSGAARKSGQDFRAFFRATPLPDGPARRPSSLGTWGRATRMGRMTPDQRWLAAVWSFVRDQLPPAPAAVLEIGCGPLGGFVPELLRGGYDAVGVDPEAPATPGYHRVEFEHYELPRPVD